MRPRSAVYSADVHGLPQAPIQAIVNDIPDAKFIRSNERCISGLRGTTTVLASESTTAAMSQLDTYASTYFQPLSIFNVIVTGIVNVRSSKRYG